MDALCQPTSHLIFQCSAQRRNPASVRTDTTLTLPLTDGITAEALRALSLSPSVRLGDLPASDCPETVGVYTLWDSNHFLYVGIAKVDPAQTQNPQARGIRGRLNTYRKSRLTSEFAVSVFLRFVVPRLTSEQIRDLGSGSLTMKDMTVLVQQHIRSQVHFRTWSCDVMQAAALERHIRASGLPNIGLPLFNPL